MHRCFLASMTSLFIAEEDGTSAARLELVSEVFVLCVLLHGSSMFSFLSSRICREPHAQGTSKTGAQLRAYSSDMTWIQHRLEPFVSTSSSSPVHLTWTDTVGTACCQMIHSNVIAMAQDRVVSGTENSHSSHILYTFHNHGSAARIGFHDIREQLAKRSHWMWRSPTRLTT